MTTNPPRTAFVLAGGASLGALQVGMLRALYERSIAPDFLVGTSAGALNAAFIASRPQTVETAEELGGVWREVRRHHAFPVQLLTLVAGLANRGSHLVPDNGLRRLISHHIQIERVEQATVPLHLVCYDVLSGKQVRLSEGPALEAVLASATIPGVLPPVDFGEWLLVDGGVVNNTPISHAVELGAERIYVLPTGDPGARGLRAGPKGALSAALHAFQSLVGAQLEADLVRYADAAELIVLPAANPGQVQPTDFDHADALMREALLAARAVLNGAQTRRQSSRRMADPRYPAGTSSSSSALGRRPMAARAAVRGSGETTSTTSTRVRRSFPRPRAPRRAHTVPAGDTSRPRSGLSSLRPEPAREESPVATTVLGGVGDAPRPVGVRERAGQLPGALLMTLGYYSSRVPWLPQLISR